MEDNELQKQLQEVVNTAYFFRTLKSDEHFLFESLNTLFPSVFNNLGQEYSDKASTPVNELRLLCTELKQEGKLITREWFYEKMEEISSKYDKDVFRSWRNPFNVFYPFFLKAENTNSKSIVEEILTQTIQQLGLGGAVSSKLVDFNGSQYFGSDRIWFAIYNSSHPNQRSAQQLFFELNAKGIFISRYDRVNNVQIETEQLNPENFKISQIVEFFKKFIDEILNDEFDEINVILASREIYKISHGPNVITEEQYKKLLDSEIIIVHEETPALGRSVKTQFEEFCELKNGDLIYLCRGNQRIVLVAQIIEEVKICAIEELGDDGWYQRKYSPLAFAQENNGFFGPERFWWLPNANTTFRKIPKVEYNLANKLIFIPFFGRTIQNLFADISANQPSENSLEKIEILNASNFSIKDNNITPILDIDKIAKKFGGIIENLEDNKGQMLGVFGPWGRGKTFFVNELCKYLHINYETGESERQSEFYFVKFHAWKYQDTEAIWAYLYEEIAKSYYGHKYKKSWEYPTQILGLRQVKLLILIPIRKLLIEKQLLFRLNFQRNGARDLVYFTISSIIYLFLPSIIKLIPIKNYIDTLYWAKSLVMSIGFFWFLRFSYQIFQISKKGKRIVRKYTERPTFNHLLGVQAEIQGELKKLFKAWVKIELRRREWKSWFFPKILQYIGVTKIEDWKHIRLGRLKWDLKHSVPGKRVLLFVDDIDRCHEEQIIKVVDALRVLLEDEEISKRLIVLTAIDERILSRAIIYKYRDIFDIEKNLLKHGEERKLEPKNLLKEYLDKLFIAGIKLSALNISDQYKILRRYAEDGKFLEPDDKIRSRNIENIDENVREYIDDTEGSIEGPDDFDGDIDFEDDEKVKKMDYLLSRQELEWIHREVSINDESTPRQLRILMYRYMFAKSLAIEFMGRNRMNTKWSEFIIREIVKKSFDIDYQFDITTMNSLEHTDELTKLSTPKIIEMVVPY